jgi:hypothetical protein
MKIYALRVCYPSGEHSVAFHTFIWEVPSSNADCPLTRFFLIFLRRGVNIFVVCSHGPLSPISNSYIQFISIFSLYNSVLCNNSSFSSKCAGQSLQEDKGPVISCNPDLIRPVMRRETPAFTWRPTLVLAPAPLALGPVGDQCLCSDTVTTCCPQSKHNVTLPLCFPI